MSVLLSLWRRLMPLGMQDGRISKARLRASSMYNRYYGPYNAWLQARNYGSTGGGWVAGIRYTQQWIQVDLEKVSTLKGVATQGRYDASQYVMSYVVTYSRNGRRFVPYREGRQTRVIHFSKSALQILNFKKGLSTYLITHLLLNISNSFS